MVSALDSGSSVLGSSASRGHCVVFLGKMDEMGTGECWRVYTCDGLVSDRGEYAPGV